ncbi:MAG: Uma2 family endonuclease [Spirulinaceae cyanobacterium]
MVQQLQPLSLNPEQLYPDSDGKPLADNTIQLRLIFTIKGGLDALFKAREDVFVAADLLWYPVQLTPDEVRAKKKPPAQAPDVMVVFGRPKTDRGSYRQWQEENIAPRVAFEILSPSNSPEEMQKKFAFYQTHGIEEYYLYDPKKNQLQGWLRQGGKLTPIAQIENWQSPLLGIRFSTREGDLALFHPDGERFVDFVEVVEQRDRAIETADRERQAKEQTQAALEEANQKNQQLLERLRRLGVDPETLL